MELSLKFFRLTLRRPALLATLSLFGLAAGSELRSVSPGPTPAAAGARTEAGACGSLTPDQVYARLKQETFSHNTYTALYYQSTERGARHEVFVRGRLRGKYRQNPARWCEKRLSLEASFPEQAGPGTQECYSGQDDVDRLLMPGAYRVLGAIPMFPEDPKASYLNGENEKRIAVWKWFDNWDRMREGGRLAASCEQRRGKPTWVLTLVRGRNPDPLYHHQEVRIFVDPALWFPIRVETYAAQDPKPVMIYDFEEVKLDVPLSDNDLGFEGLAPRWNLVSVPGGPKLEALAQEEPSLKELPGLDPLGFAALLEQALAGVSDYATELTLELRYFRLRQARVDQFLYLKPSQAFSALTTHLETNYMLVNSGEGFRTVVDPARDRLLHVLPAGVYRVMGEQTFPTDDPRLFSALGDNLTELNFFFLRDELKQWLYSAQRIRVALAAYPEGKGPWLEITRPDPGIPAQPTVLRILLDDQTHLPLRLEYRGYDDAKGFLAIRFAKTQTNRGLKSQDLWK